MFAGKDFTPAVIDEVRKDSPAFVSGLKKQDIILEIDGSKVKSILDVSKLIAMSTADIIDFKVSRYDQEILFKVNFNMQPDASNPPQLVVDYDEAVFLAETNTKLKTTSANLNIKSANLTIK